MEVLRVEARLLTVVVVGDEQDVVCDDLGKVDTVQELVHDRVEALPIIHSHCQEVRNVRCIVAQASADD